MPYQMNSAQFESVMQLLVKERYGYFISKISDWEELWGLKNQTGFVGMRDDDGNDGIPFWPHPDFAGALAIGEWDDCKPEKIDLETFCDKWLPGMNNDGLKAVVFPTPSQKGIILEPVELKSHIDAELPSRNEK